MPELQTTELAAPPCPISSKQMFLKQTHREHVRDLLLVIPKCPSRGVEYPVVWPAPEQGTSLFHTKEPRCDARRYLASLTTEAGMAVFDDDSDVGPIVITVVLTTLVAGAFIYGWNRYNTVQTALNIPAIERTVPPIVPNQPQF
jgi:hypothetical protein